MKWLLRWFFLLGFAFFGVAAHAQAVCSRSSLTVLRKAPSQKAEKTWMVAKYMPFLILEIKDGWLKLEDSEKQVHYGRSSDFTQKIRCVVVKANTADTRQGPGTKYPYGEFKTLDRYTPLKRLDAKDGWVEVENDIGLKSWIQESKVWHPVKVQTLSF